MSTTSATTIDREAYIQAQIRTDAVWGTAKVALGDVGSYALVAELVDKMTPRREGPEGGMVRAEAVEAARGVLAARIAHGFDWIDRDLDVADRLREAVGDVEDESLYFPYPLPDAWRYDLAGDAAAAMVGREAVRAMIAVPGHCLALAFLRVDAGVATRPERVFVAAIRAARDAWRAGRDEREARWEAEEAESA